MKTPSRSDSGAIQRIGIGPTNKLNSVSKTLLAGLSVIFSGVQYSHITNRICLLIMVHMPRTLTGHFVRDRAPNI